MRFPDRTRSDSGCLCNSGHRCPRDSHGLWRPRVWPWSGGACRDIETPLYPDAQSSGLCSAPPRDSSVSISLPSCPPSHLFPPEVKASLSAEMTTFLPPTGSSLQSSLIDVWLIMGQSLRFFSTSTVCCFKFLYFVSAMRLWAP